MIPMTLRAVADATGGELSPLCDPDRVVSANVVIDSRLVRPGDLFVAVKGETHDGHLFAAEALRAGAVAVVSHTADGDTGIVVDDSVAALGRLAHDVLSSSTATVVGVTGSSGKTSTKDMLGQVFAAFGPTTWPPGSFNNDIGMPLTVLGINEQTESLILEYGARGLNHIATLCSVARPQIAVVTNVGSAHVGEFGSTEAIVTAKSELVEALGSSGVAVLNRDDSRVASMADRTGGEIRWYGMDPACDVRIVQLELDQLARPRFDIAYDGDNYSVALKGSGAHQAYNAAATFAAAISAGHDPRQVAVSLSEVEPQSRWRMEVVSTVGGAIVINDAYNANPESMLAALRALVTMKRPGGNTWAVVGEMRELGDESLLAHDEVGRRAVRLGVDRLVGVGDGARAVVLGAASEGHYGGEAYYAHDQADALAHLVASVGPNDVVLFKASRAIGLEELASAFIAHQGGPLNGSEVSP